MVSMQGEEQLVSMIRYSANISRFRLIYWSETMSTSAANTRTF